jgi:hypothetical protein
MGNIVDHIETVGGGGSGEDLTKSVTQANTFSAGDVIYRSGSVAVLSYASMSATAEVWGVVESATSSSFNVVTQGELTVSSHGYGSDGDTLYLSADTGGLMTNVEPTLGVSKPVGFVIDTNTIHVSPMRGFSVGGVDGTYAFQEFEFTGDGSSVNFDLPTDVAYAESVMVFVGAIFQSIEAYDIIGDGNGNPRRLQFTEAPEDTVKIKVRYLGVIKAVNPVTPTNSTDYNSGVPVPLALTSTTETSNIQDDSNFVFNHGLGVIPKSVEIRLKCLSAEHGYSVNDEVPIQGFKADTVQDPLVTPIITSSTISLRFDKDVAGAFYVLDASYVHQTIDLSKWGAVVYANEEMGGTNGVISAVNTPATEFESSAIQITTTNTHLTDASRNPLFILPHGLGQKPKSFRTVFLCLESDSTYDVGDEIDIAGGLINNGSGNDTTHMSSVDATNCRWVVAPGYALSILKKDGTGFNTTPDLSKWGIKFYANSELGGYKGDRGPAGTGKIAQVKHVEITNSYNITGAIPDRTSVPLNSEMTLIGEVTITPKNPDSTLIIETDIQTSNTDTDGVIGLFIDSATEATGIKLVQGLNNAGGWSAVPVTMKKVLSSNGTNTRTYKVYAGALSGSQIKINLSDTGTDDYGGTLFSSLIVTEILP